MPKEKPTDLTKGMGRSLLQQGNRIQQAGETYFLGIGINAYNNGWPPLRNAVRDVQAIAEVLAKDYGVHKHQLLLDGDATRENILRALDDLADTISAPDSLIVYYAGHGHLNKRKRGFWVPQDAKANELGALIPNTTLRDHLQDIKTLHTLLISDACFSGTMFVRTKDKVEDLSIKELARLPSRWAICSGRDDEVVSDGPENGHSPFAQSILDVLQKTEEPFFTANYLSTQVCTQTRANYKQLPDGGVLMGIGHGRGMYVFIKTLNERLAWEEAQQENTVLAYEQYMALFPKGKEVVLANRTVQELKSEVAWKEISSLPEAQLSEVKVKINRLFLFCDQFSNGSHYQEAMLLGERMDAKKEFLQAYNSIFKLMKLRQERGPYLSEIEARLEDLKIQRTEEEGNSSYETPKTGTKPLLNKGAGTKGAVPAEKKIDNQSSSLRFNAKLPLLYQERRQRPLKVAKDKKGSFYIVKQLIELPLANTKVDFIDNNNKVVNASVVGRKHFIKLQITSEVLSEKELSLVANGKAFRYSVSLKSNVAQTYKHIFAAVDNSEKKHQIHLEKGTEQLLEIPAGYPVILTEKSVFKPYLGHKRIILVLLAGILLTVGVKALLGKITPPGSSTPEQQSGVLSPPSDTLKTVGPGNQMELSSADKVLYEAARAYRVEARTQLNAKAYDGVKKIFDRVKIENHIGQLGGIKYPPSEVAKLLEELFEINNTYYENGYRKDEYELITHKVKIDSKTEKPETTSGIATQRKVTVAEIIKYNPQEVDAKGRILENPDGSLPILIIYRKIN